MPTRGRMGRCADSATRLWAVIMMHSSRSLLAGAISRAGVLGVPVLSNAVLLRGVECSPGAPTSIAVCPRSPAA